MDGYSLKYHLVKNPITYDFTLHDFGGVLGRLLDTFFWALTISWLRPLACVRSDPQCQGSLLNTTDQNPSVSKFNRFHVVIFWVFFF